MCRRAVSNDNVGAGPHHGRRLVARVQRCEPQGLRLAPPHRVVAVGGEGLVAVGIEHVTGQDAVGLGV